MQIEFDPGKRDKTLAERGLDFARAGEVFSGHHFTDEDAREDYNELRYFRATGKGWQTRMNDALKDWLKTHPTP